MFSPYYARARARTRAGAADPLAHCAINIAVYGPGAERWAFTEYGAAAVERGVDRLQVGHSRIGWEGDCLVIRFDERTPMFGQRVTGTVRLYPSALPGQREALDARGRHAWWPVAPHAHVVAELTAPALTLRGSGYHDANFGSEPLEAGFCEWSWSRAALADRTAVLYDARRRDGSALQLGRLFHADGRVDPLSASQATSLGRTRWWIARSIRTDGAPATVVRTLLDTPFYARTQVATQVGAVPVRAMHESLSLSRFCSPVVQRLLSFRIRRSG